MSNEPSVNPPENIIKSAYEELNQLRTLLIESNHHEAELQAHIYELESQLAAQREQIERLLAEAAHS